MKIHAVQTGWVAIKENHRQGVGSGGMRTVNVLLGRQWTPMLPIYTWVIEHPEGLIVVDTGDTWRINDPGYFPRWHPFFQTCNRFDIKPDDEVGHVMRSIGLSPDDVRWVVLTHLHTDHAGGLHHFPKAQILVSHKEFAAAQGFSGKISGYLLHHMPEWFNPTLIDFNASPYASFPASYTLTHAGDVILVSTAGHSVGHLSVIVRESTVDVFLAGDTSYTEAFLKARVVDGVSPNEAHARYTHQNILDYATRQPMVYLPTHDPDSASRLAARQPLLP